MTRDSAPHVVVAGAGVTGLTVALALADAGARVTVCDPVDFSRTASGVAAGMLAPAFEAALDEVARPHFPLLRHARDLWPRFAGEIRTDIERVGAEARGDPDWLARVATRLTEVGAEHSVERGGVFTSEDWRINIAYANVGLFSATFGRGVDRLKTTVQRFEPGKATLADGSDLAADIMVVATGAASGLAPEQALLTPIKGHILHLPPLLPHGPVIRGEGVYLCPSVAGLIVGATMEEGRSDLTVDVVQARRLRAAATRFAPLLEFAKADVRVGVRAATPDGLPLVGPSSTPGVILAAGMRRNGWLLAPLVAEIVAAYALGREPGPWAPALHPARFATV